MSARDHVVEAVHVLQARGWLVVSPAEQRAGYRILAPGELDKETVERCVKAVNGDKAVQGLARARMVTAFRSLGDGK